jgi:tetratricopeptide (TPR) repeat protein
MIQDQSQASEEMTTVQLVESAKIFIDAKKWQDAILLIENARQKQYLSDTCLEMLADSYSHQKNYGKAISIYMELSDKQPNHAKWFYRLAFQYKMNKESSKAVAAYEKCIQLYPEWLKAYHELGKLLESIGSVNEAKPVYKKGIKIFQSMNSNLQKELSPIFSSLSSSAAKLLCEMEPQEAETLFAASVHSDVSNSDAWYQYGSFLLKNDRPKEAILPLQKAHELNQGKDYIPHKLAQAYLSMDDPDQALRVYETIPVYRQIPYILNGMGKCFQKKGCYKDALALFYQASKKEPTKGYHFEHMGMALAALGDKDQAIVCLTKCNVLFADEFGKGSSKILARIEELRNLPHKQNVNLSDFDKPAPTDSRGKITAYNSERGFGFIEDEIDKQKVFFHIKKVKRGFEPSVGSRVRFLREVGEKGLMASRVWPIN